MKFNLTSSNGKAGEYYFAYWISRFFKWPCRLLDVDVGIDAQIEIFDDENHSTGDFLAVQVKTTQDQIPNVAVGLDNLEYWSSIEDVVILVSICLGSTEPKIYWKRINGLLIEDYILQAKQNKSKTTSIQFGSGDLLEPAHKDSFSRLPYEGNIKKLEKLISEAKTLCNKINSIFPNDDCQNFSLTQLQDNFDYQSIGNYIAKFNSACKIKDEIDETIKGMPKINKFIPSMNEVDSLFDQVVANMTEFISSAYEIDNDYDYAIGRQWRTSETHKIVLRIFEEKYPD